MNLILSLGTLYLHLLACCVAICTVLTSDFALLKNLIRSKSINDDDGDAYKNLEAIQITVSRALLILWATGMTLIVMGVSAKGWSYIENPKLHAKISVVILLTLNGLLLHKHVLPRIQLAGSLLKLADRPRAIATFVGSLSAVSWCFAAFLGIARPLAWKYPTTELLSVYLIFVAGGFCMMFLVTKWAKNKSDQQSRITGSALGTGS